MRSAVTFSTFSPGRKLGSVRLLSMRRATICKSLMPTFRTSRRVLNSNFSKTLYAV